LAGRNHVEPSIATAFAYMGVTDVYGASIEYDEFADERLADSIRQAEAAVDSLVSMLGQSPAAAAQPPGAPFTAPIPA
jgi:FMN-dependent NADH-azoreductase